MPPKVFTTAEENQRAGRSGAKAASSIMEPEPTSTSLGVCSVPGSQGPSDEWPGGVYWYVCARQLQKGPGHVVPSLGPMPSQEAAVALKDAIQGILMRSAIVGQPYTSRLARVTFWHSFSQGMGLGEPGRGDVAGDKEIWPWQWAVAAGYSPQASPSGSALPAAAQETVAAAYQLIEYAGAEVLNKRQPPLPEEVGSIDRFAAAVAIGPYLTALSVGWAAIASQRRAQEETRAPTDAGIAELMHSYVTLAETAFVSNFIPFVRADADASADRALQLGISAASPSWATTTASGGAATGTAASSPAPSDWSGLPDPTSGASTPAPGPAPAAPMAPMGAPAGSAMGPMGPPAPAPMVVSPAGHAMPMAPGGAAPAWLSMPQVKAVLDAWGRALEQNRTAVYRMDDGQLLRVSPKDHPPLGGTLITYEWEPMSKKGLHNAFFGVQRNTGFNSRKTITVAGTSPYASGSKTTGFSPVGHVSTTTAAMPTTWHTTIRLSEYDPSSTATVRNRSYVSVPTIKGKTIRVGGRP